MSAPVKLQFRCSVCTRELTDAEAIFTSCGHFFCPRCTKIQPGSSGTCEVCGSDADSGSLTGKGLSYNEHVRTFVFGDPVDELHKAAEMLKFHQIHHNLFSKNVRTRMQQHSRLAHDYKQVTLSHRQLEADLQRMRGEWASMKRQVQALAAENQILKKELAKDHGTRRGGDAGNFFSHAHGRTGPRQPSSDLKRPASNMRLSLRSSVSTPTRPEQRRSQAKHPYGPSSANLDSRRSADMSRTAGIQHGRDSFRGSRGFALPTPTFAASTQGTLDPPSFPRFSRQP